MCRNHLAWFLAGCNRPPYQPPTFRLGSVHPQTSWIILYKTSLDPIWLTVSGFGQTDLVRKQAGVQELSSLLLVNASQMISVQMQIRSGLFTGHARTYTWKSILCTSYAYILEQNQKTNNVYGLKGQTTNL